MEKKIIHSSNGIPHRLDGPAIMNEDGSEGWYINGLKHRFDGPAVTLADGSKYWYFNGVLHREDGGPAIEYHDGTKYWYLLGRKHRLDGPAVEKSTGTRQYWLFGFSMTKEVYEKMVSEIKNVTSEPKPTPLEKTYLEAGSSFGESSFESNELKPSDLSVQYESPIDEFLNKPTEVSKKTKKVSSDNKKTFLGIVIDSKDYED